MEKTGKVVPTELLMAFSMAMQGTGKLYHSVRSSYRAANDFLYGLAGNR